jgi:hypothetical protein
MFKRRSRSLFKVCHILSFLFFLFEWYGDKTSLTCPCFTSEDSPLSPSSNSLIYTCILGLSQNLFTSSESRHAGVERNVKVEGASNSKILSIFDHVVRNSSSIKSNYQHDKDIFAITLGGPDRKTLFMLATEFRGVDKIKEVVISQAPAPGAGWP